MTNTRAFILSLVLATAGAAQSTTEISFAGLRESNPTPSFDHGYVAAWDLQHSHHGSFIPRSSLPAWEAPGLDGVLRPVIGMWSMRATTDRIGARLQVGALKNAWVELDLNGNLIGKWIYTGTMNDWASPAAFDSKGLLYGIHWMNHKRVGLSVFDKATSTWNPIPTLPGHLIAADGTRLLYQDGDQLRWIQGLNTDLAESASATQP